MKHLLTTLFLITCFLANGQIEFKFSQIEKLPEHINSPFEESCPLFNELTNRLYFTRTLHPDNKGGKDLGQDLWYVDLQGNSWGEPKNDLKALNNYLNNSAIGISGDGERMYMVGTYIKKINLQTGFSVTEREDGNWIRPVALDIPTLNLRTPLFYGGYITPSEDVLIISMNSKDSKGEEDLYAIIKTESGWGKPIWLGDSVNSSGFEISPYLFDDGKTLLFASNGMGGLGDCDLFYAYRKDSSWTNWSTPQNLGEGINSTGFDAFPFAVGPKLYFSSNREDSLSNIYLAENELFYLEADTVQLVFESFGNRIPNVHVDVVGEDDEVIGTFSADQNGIVSIPGLKEKKQYAMVPRHENVDISMFKPYILNDKGEYVEELALGNDGKVNLTPRTSESLAKTPVIEKPTYVTGMRGIFEVDRVPVRNTILALTDSTGKIYQYAVTDKKGSFSFVETPDSLSLGIQVISELEYVKQNGVIYYTDDQGNKLFKTLSDPEGKFKYQKIKAKELAQLKMLVRNDTKLETEKTQNAGVFKYDNLPQEGVTLYLYDENDNLIEQVVTDKDGKFVFTKLKADQDFKIKPADQSLEDGSLVFTDSQGNELNALESSEFGFKYTALNSDIMKGLRLLDEEDSDVSLAQNFVFSIGLFKFKNLPKEGITLRLLDENQRVIETVTTDENGHFVFSMLKPDHDYKVQVVGLEDESLMQSQLYFVDKNGTVVTGKLQKDFYSFKELNPDYFFSISQVNDGETELIITESFKDVIGRFKYQNLGKEGVLLELLDENNKVIETVYTDENGEFRFKQLAKESNYFVKVAEKDAGLLDAASFEMMNDSNEPLEQEEVTEDGFSFKTLPRSSDAMAGMADGDGGSLDVSKFLDDPKQKEESKPIQSMPSGDNDALSGMKNDLMLKTLYFNFNSVRLSNYDRYHLNHSVFQKVQKSSQPILVVGYTCDLGTKTVNQEIALERAKAIKAYLIELGLEADRIEVEGIAPEDDVTMTHGQRLESRRVEIFHLAP